MKKIQEYTLQDLVLDESFQRYIRDGSDVDKAFWEEYLIQNPKKESLIIESKKVLNQIYEFLPPEEFKQELEKFISIVEADKTTFIQPEKKRSFSYYAIAASVSAILLISLVWIFSHQLTQPSQKTEVVSIVERSTERGQRSNLVLRDGTKIKLNAQSFLSYPKNFKKNLREVHVTGEAFFEVTKDEERPFIVHLGDLSLKVLGTSFNIRSYPDENKLKVSLATGKVEVSRDGVVEASLTPNMEAVYDRFSNEITVSQFDPRLTLAWKEDIIRFKRANFTEIVNVLEKWYNVDISYDESMAAKDFTGEFENMALEDILKGMQHTLNFDYKIRGKKVKLFTNKRKNEKHKH
ncbi:FecR domain-containing protein [Reichenbachiella sp. MALMAid0571]|uniref:FecR family protein n=1 Tax=Reichenbachiella sp. MALMAid0571 TaxID=3143939 RepID=UPI0032DF772C